MLALLLFPVTSHQPKERIRLFGCGSKRNESANSNGGESQSINVHVEKDEGTEDPKVIDPFFKQRSSKYLFVFCFRQVCEASQSTTAHHQPGKNYLKL